MGNEILKTDMLWGEFDHRFTPLISFCSIIDTDMALIKNILINYRNESIFDLKQDKKYFEILGELYRSKFENPLYYLMKDDTEENRLFLDECYGEFLTEREDEVLKYGVSSDMYNLVREFKNTSEITPTILYYTNHQKDVLDNDSLLSTIDSVCMSELKIRPELRNQYDQFYFKYLSEADLFLDLQNKSFYISTAGRNLSPNNDDIDLSNKDVFMIYGMGNRINLFDMYRKDIIGGIKHNDRKE